MMFGEKSDGYVFWMMYFLSLQKHSVDPPTTITKSAAEEMTTGSLHLYGSWAGLYFGCCVGRFMRKTNICGHFCPGYITDASLA